MRVSRDKLAAHKAALLEQAGRLFRQRGIEAVGVADITKAAGLTHGAFYGHFASKTDLAAQSLGGSLVDGAAHWRARADTARRDGTRPLDAIVDKYLTETNRDQPEEACALPSLGGELSRADGGLRAALDAGVSALILVLEEEIATERPSLAPAEISRIALAMLSAMAGGMLLARACAADPARSRSALRSAAGLARAAADVLEGV